MNKAESKYYNTALLMNQALIELLNKKEYDFITIKEICEKAGVNRSTFYLHYESINDLLEECVENLNKQFLTYFDEKTNEFFTKIQNCEKEELILITPEYLFPYLKYIKENRIVHQVAIKHVNIMKSDKKFNLLFAHVFKPIFNRFGVDNKSAGYIIAYYINGINAIVNKWISQKCEDEIEYISDLIINCIRPYINEKSGN